MRKGLAVLACWAIGCGGGGATGPGVQSGGGGGGGSGGGGGQCAAGAPEQLGNVDDQGQLGVTQLENGAIVAFRRDRETIQLVHLREDGVLNKPIWLTSDVRPSIARPPVAVWNGSEYLVAWIEQPPDGMASLRARRVDAQGQAIGQNVLGIGNMEITGGAELLAVDGGFAAVWVAGLQLSGIRFAAIDAEGMSVRRDTIDLGIMGLEDMRAEAVPGGIQITWKNGRVQLSAGGTVDGQAEEGNGLSRDDPRPPTWQGARPQIPGSPPAWSEGLALGDRLAVSWAETQATSYGIKLGIFDRQGAMVGGPYDVAQTSGGTTDVPMGLARYQGGVAVFWVDKPSSTVSWTLLSGCN